MLEKTAEGLPALIYSEEPTNKSLIVIERGQKGYRPLRVPRERQNGLTPDVLNARLSPPPTKAQIAAMIAGSMFGWSIPAANPANYDANGRIR